MITQKSTYKIKTVKGELVVITEGQQLMSGLTKKADLEKALQLSLAHKWLAEKASTTSKFAISHSNQLPTTDSKDFLLTAFYTAVKLVVENLVVIEELPISEAIQAGNSLIKGQKVVSNSFLIHEQIKEALRYRLLAHG
jgi:hypothetical protein